MNGLAKLVAMALAFLAAAPCFGQARGGAAGQAAGERPAVAYSSEGILYLASETGGVVRTIEAELPIGDFAIAPDLTTVVFTVPHADEVGGPLFVLDVASGKIEPMGPDPYFNDATVADLAEFYSEPEFSPDGRQVVFATHADAEGSDVQTSGPLAVLDMATRNVLILKSTVGANGLPLGNMHDPHWSPDGKQILGNIEGYVFVTDAGGAALVELVIPENERSQSADSYGAIGIGWLGRGCVLYQAGEEPQSDPLRAFWLSTRGTSSAAAMLRVPEDSLRGVREFSGRLRIFADAEGYRVEGPGIRWSIRGDQESVFVQLLPQMDGGEQIPAECR